MSAHLEKGEKKEEFLLNILDVFFFHLCNSTTYLVIQFRLVLPSFFIHIAKDNCIKNFELHSINIVNWLNTKYLIYKFYISLQIIILHTFSVENNYISYLL